MAFDSIILTLSLNSVRGHKEEISEAVAIRVFYSSLDIWLNARNRDVHGAVYSLIRMIAEIPLYYCWNSGLICGSYQTQLEVGVSRTSLTRLEAFDLVKSCVECKISVLVLRSDICGHSVYRFIEECVSVFCGVIHALGLERAKLGHVSLVLLHTLRASLNSDLGLGLSKIGTAWKCYRRSVPDGRTRYQYLSKRIDELGPLASNEVKVTHFPIRIAELQKRSDPHT